MFSYPQEVRLLDHIVVFLICIGTSILISINWGTNLYSHPNSWCFSLFLYHMKVSRLGVKSELWLPAYTTATATPHPSCVCKLHHSYGNAIALTNWLRPGIEPTSPWIARFVTTEQWWEIPLFLIYLFIFVVFLGPHQWHMEFPRLGVESELQLLAYTIATTPDPSCVCDLPPQLMAIPGELQGNSLSCLFGNSHLILVLICISLITSDVEHIQYAAYKKFFCSIFAIVSGI